MQKQYSTGLFIFYKNLPYELTLKSLTRSINKAKIIGGCGGIPPPQIIIRQNQPSRDRVKVYCFECTFFAVQSKALKLESLFEENNLSLYFILLREGRGAAVPLSLPGLQCQATAIYVQGPNLKNFNPVANQPKTGSN